VFIDVLRSDDLPEWEKVLWVMTMLVLPLIGVLLFLIVRGKKLWIHESRRVSTSPSSAAVYASSIRVLCRRCGGEFLLRELAERRDGSCPLCAWLLSPDWTWLLLAEATDADRAHQALAKALRRLVGLSGNLLVPPHSVLQNLFDEVGWEVALVTQPEVIRDALRELHEEICRWDDLALGQDRTGVADRLRWVAIRLRYVGDIVEQTRDPNGGALRSAASGLESAAVAVAENGAGSVIDERLREARRTVEVVRKG
jgi:hypothetical protein